MAEKLINSNVHVILGLGNPGKEYEHTYHNAGILFVEYLSQKHSALDFKHPSHKSFEYTEFNGRVFVRPLTYMNESGLAAHEILRFFKIDPSEFLIAHDDSDMHIGTYKISYGQRSGGHNGINSIINHLNTNEFWRLKIGVREPQEQIRKKANDFVLSPISTKHMKELQKVFLSAEEELFKKYDA